MFTRDIVQGFLGMSVPAINMMQWRELKEGEKLVSQSGDWEVLRRDSERGLNWQLLRAPDGQELYLYWNMGVIEGENGASIPELSDPDNPPRIVKPLRIVR